MTKIIKVNYFKFLKNYIYTLISMPITFEEWVEDNI